MCGLCGWASFGGAPVERDLVARATATLRHRGPDDEGFWSAPGVALGFRRLAVMDLSAHANQPFVNSSGDVALVCNGEIFNFRVLRSALAKEGYSFHTDNDTEVCLHAYQHYGPDFVSHLSGMFALAIVDLKRRKVLLARDRLGIKPLYYRIDQRGISFASELKALLCDQSVVPEIDPLALNLFTVQDAVPAPFTIYRGLKKLPPAQVLEVDLDRGPQSARHSVYWELPYDEFSSSATPEDLAEELSALLHEVVENQSMSDVPLGLFLSGGMDSSSVLALQRASDQRPIVTFTAGFEDPDNDESSIAAELSKHFGTEHHTLRIDRTLLDTVDQVLPLFDEPFGDSSAIPSYAIAAAASRHVSVVLTGEGGDELFGGYLRPRDAAGLRWACRLPSGLRRTLAAGVPKLGPLARMQRFRLPNWALIASLHHPVVDPLRRSILRQRWQCPTDELIATYQPLRDRLQQRPPLQGYFDALLSRYLPDDLLTKVDRMSAAHGLEARVPLLDHRVVEWAARVPAQLKIRGNSTKFILRKAMADRVPGGALRQPKRGFGLPSGFTEATAMRQRVVDLAKQSDAVADIIDIGSAPEWDGATGWRALALATWIVRVHEQGIDVSNGVVE